MRPILSILFALGALGSLVLCYDIVVRVSFDLFFLHALALACLASCVAGFWQCAIRSPEQTRGKTAIIILGLLGMAAAAMLALMIKALGQMGH